MNKSFKISQWRRKHSGEKKSIKVIGVGCGGGNVVNHLHDFGSNEFSLAVCGMDRTALKCSKVPTTLQLGIDGLGAGNNPEVGQLEAEKKAKDIRILLENNTDIVFIVTCLGGGCGTGAAPVIARESRALGITTIGVASIPFDFEGNKRYEQALNGVRELTKNSDALFLLNNQSIIRHHRGLPMAEVFANADKMMCEVIEKLADSISVSSKG